MVVAGIQDRSAPAQRRASTTVGILFYEEKTIIIDLFYLNRVVQRFIVLHFQMNMEVI